VQIVTGVVQGRAECPPSLLQEGMSQVNVDKLVVWDGASGRGIEGDRAARVGLEQGGERPGRIRPVAAKVGDREGAGIAERSILGKVREDLVVALQWRLCRQSQ